MLSFRWPGKYSSRLKPALRLTSGRQGFYSYLLRKNPFVKEILKGVGWYNIWIFQQLGTLSAVADTDRGRHDVCLSPCLDTFDLSLNEFRKFNVNYLKHATTKNTIARLEKNVHDRFGRSHHPCWL